MLRGIEPVFAPRLGNAKVLFCILLATLANKLDKRYNAPYMGEQHEGLSLPIEEECFAMLKYASHARFFSGNIRAGTVLRVLKLDKVGNTETAWVGPKTMSEEDIRDFKPELVKARDKRYPDNTYYNVMRSRLVRVLD
ncbi:MAG: hypothetical protein G01um10148_904 [Parcubacteria group bacterium Gr01-1014_8]|nr:MAG: hypothetical protein G01um10148_904 [Parcubacteria group bacterium Gr01-1014_8]